MKVVAFKGLKPRQHKSKVLWVTENLCTSIIILRLSEPRDGVIIHKIFFCNKDRKVASWRRLAIFFKKKYPIENTVSLSSHSDNVNWNSCKFHRHPKLTLRGWNVISIDASETVSRYKRWLRRFMRNKILRSANDKYRYILPFDQ